MSHGNKIIFTMTQMNNSTTLMNADVTKSGFVSLWEQGGSRRNTGEAIIVAKPDGTMPTAVYIPKGGHLFNGQHALIPVHPGYWVIKTSHYRQDFSHEIYEVVCGFVENNVPKVELRKINEFSRGEWNVPVKIYFKAAIEAAEKKATDYHCRSAYFAVLKEKNNIYFLCPSGRFFYNLKAMQIKNIPVQPEIRSSPHGGKQQKTPEITGVFQNLNIRPRSLQYLSVSATVYGRV